MSELWRRLLAPWRRRRAVRQMLVALPCERGRYRRAGPIALGSFAEIERCFDRERSNTVAVKVLRKERCRRPGLVAGFLNEAQLLAPLTHPGLVRVSDVFLSDDGRPAYAMELVAGQTLRRRLAGEAGARALPVGVALALFASLGEALAYAHARGILHLDVKPDNLLVVPGPPERLVLVDWGNARVFDRARCVEWRRSVGATELLPSTWTRGPLILGTPAYMSPEQTRWPGELLTPASDVFSAGVVLYEMLTGVQPFGAASAVETVGRVRTWTPPPVHEVEPALSPELGQVCARLMEKDPERRCPDLGAALAALAPCGLPAEA